MRAGSDEVAPAPVEAAAPLLAAPPGVAGAAGVLMWQAVLGERDAPLGYRFFLSEAAAVRAGGAAASQGVDAWLIHQVSALSPAWRRQRRIFLELDAGSLDVEALARLGGLGVTLILEPAPAGAALMGALAELRASGFSVFLSVRAGAPRWSGAVIGLADGLALRFGGESPASIEAAVEVLAADHPGASWCALELPTVDDLVRARRLGCVAATGPFVNAHSACLGGRFSADGLRVTSLLSKLRQGAEIREMAGVLKQDVALSYRLLRYVNAAAWGMTTPINSIEHAMLMLGRRPLYRWLMLLLLAGAPRAALTEVRGEATLVRARFMELLGESLSVSQRDELFVLGMLSRLDTVLQVPALRVLDTLPMSDTVRAALGDPAAADSPYAPYLALARAWDSGDFAAVQAACERLGLSPEAATRRHLQAFEWVLENGQ